MWRIYHAFGFGKNIGPPVAWGRGAHRKPPEPKFGKLFAYRARMHDNTEALFDQVLQVDTPPTWHHAVHLRVRTRANDLGKFRLLRGAQVRRDLRLCPGAVSVVDNSIDTR